MRKFILFLIFILSSTITGCEKNAYNNSEDSTNVNSSITQENKQDAPDGYTPSVGDFALYAPWENIVFYYNDFTYSSGLIPLGHIDSGIDIIGTMNQGFTMQIEKIEK